MEDTVTTNVIKRNGEEVHFDRAKIVKRTAMWSVFTR